MAGYVGNVPVPQSVREDQSFTATAGQTTFNTLGYTDGTRIKVTLNGVLLEGGGVDYTATNGSDVVLTVAAAADDILRFETFNEVQLVSSVTTTPTFKTSATLLNETEEDTDGGRESTLIFQGEQSGGELSTLAEIEASHDGTADDEKGDLIFRTNDGNDGTSPTERLRINSAGDMLFSSDDPSLTIANTTHEDTDGGRESTIVFQGEQSGGEVSTLAQIEAAHDGTADDEKGDLIFRTNDGNDGASPTERMRVDSGGHVGINKTNPDTPLDVVAATGEQVVGRFAASNNSSSANNGGAILKLQNTDNTNGNQSTLVFADSTDSSIGGIFGYNTNHSNASGYITVGTRDSGTFAERVRIDHHGIKLNGDSAADNALSDYEEGTFTATLVGYYGSPSTAVTSTGQYTKIGNQVSFWINMENKDTTGASGNMWISGLPFASSGNYEICMAEMQSAGTFPSSSPFALISGTIAYFYKHASQAASTAVFHNAGTGRTIRASGTYRVA